MILCLGSRQYGALAGAQSDDEAQYGALSGAQSDDEAQYRTPSREVDVETQTLNRIPDIEKSFDVDGRCHSQSGA